MRPFALSMIFVLLAYASATDQSAQTNSKIIRGWLSDQQCAEGRASSGTFTVTNPRCAKECVAKGRKIVLIDPDGKRVLTIQNQSAARSNIGDHVEIQGTLSSTKLLHVNSLQKISTGVAACERTEPLKR
jgi:hypothetical protein